MFILDSLLIGSLRFVLDKIVAAAEAEAEDDTSLREQLLEAQMRLELGEISDEEFAGRMLQEPKVLVVPGSKFGAGGEGHVRCCYATSAEKLDEALIRIEKVVTRL